MDTRQYSSSVCTGSTSLSPWRMARPHQRPHLPSKSTNAEWLIIELCSVYKVAFDPSFQYLFFSTPIHSLAHLLNNTCVCLWELSSCPETRNREFFFSILSYYLAHWKYMTMKTWKYLTCRKIWLSSKLWKSPKCRAAQKYLLNFLLLKYSRNRTLKAYWDFLWHPQAACRFGNVTCLYIKVTLWQKTL